MNKAVSDMLAQYAPQTSADYQNALREIFQELALLGLWRANFFEHAAFYGGTALRILHGLERFSEDMDFSLLAPSADFAFDNYCRYVEKELHAWGFPVVVEAKEKRVTSAVTSAFVKAGTIQQLMTIEAPAHAIRGIHRDQQLRIKIEVDTDPPAEFATQTRYLLNPIPFAVRVYTPPSLFAGKMHALLFRKWKNRVKGRDWYDFVWYVARRVPLNLAHLKMRMVQTGDFAADQPLTERQFRQLLADRIAGLNVNMARSDIEPFVRNPAELKIWSKDFFQQVADQLIVVNNV